MKERITTDSVSTSTSTTQHSKKALSADNSLSSASGLGCGDNSGNATAASSPATIPLRLQQSNHPNNQEVIVQVQQGSSSTSSSCYQYQYQSPGSSQGASRASTLSLSHSIHNKKKVNIASFSGGGGGGGFDKVEQLKNEVDIESDVDIEGALETTALNHGGQFTASGNESRTTTPGDNYLTMSGTITRGKRAGQQADVKLNISREELELIESTHSKMKAQLESSSVTTPNGGIAGGTSSSAKNGCCFCCSCGTGPHIFIWSLISFPFVFLFASIYSFYMGTLTWYNVFSLYTEEEKPFLCRILMAPILIISYPFFILISTVGLGFYTACSSITCQLFRWKNCVNDLEKGFYAWLCSILKVEECSPYTEVVIVGQLDGLLTHSNSAPAGVTGGGGGGGTSVANSLAAHHQHLQCHRRE
ncbi:unnamed protein product [Orchesella dallaii]|uniref:Transmembrane protein 169 n=1 Tax=Orchesella dallaii TaxID=48710 RepID=A0ABP1PNF3_9HEXA